MLSAATPLQAREANRLKPDTVSPRLRQEAAWAGLAPRLGYRPRLSPGLYRTTSLHDYFDHGGTVTRRDGLRAFYGDPYRSKAQDGDLEAFAAGHGLRLAYVGPGLWHECCRFVVYEVADPVLAMDRLIRSRSRWLRRSDDPSIVVARPGDFMPRSCDMRAVERLVEERARERNRAEVRLALGRWPEGAAL